MNRQRWSNGARWLVVAIAVSTLAACHHAPDEQQVRDAIMRGAQAARSADAGAFKAVLSKDFDGNEGELERRQLVGMLRVARLRGEHLKVVTGPVALERRGERFIATFTVTLGGGRGRFLPRHLGVYEVTSAWRREGRHWRCYQASWKRRL